MTKAYKGLTWDHPRGYQALIAASERFNQEYASSGQSLSWDVQALEGFESTPLETLADQYDLLVIDHPHLGEAISHQVLRPLNDFFSAQIIDALMNQTIGQSAESYWYEGKLWALPLDVASQVLACRPDLIGEELSLRLDQQSWADIANYAEHNPVALSLGGPHALLSLVSVFLSLGGELDQDQFIGLSESVQALDLLAAIYAHQPENTAELNPIQLLERMASSDDIFLIPSIFGYVNYSRPSRGKRAVSFHNSPFVQSPQRRGSVLGGTGIAISHTCQPSDELISHLSWLLAPQTQEQFIPLQAGQPSNKQAWQSQVVNDHWGNFYRNTYHTVDQAFVRPRCKAYIEFQNHAAQMIRQALASQQSSLTTVKKINAEWQQRQLSID